MTSDPLSLTQEAYRTEERAPILPQRYRKALLHTTRAALPLTTANELGAWLEVQRQRMERVDPNDPWGWWLPTLDDQLPAVASVIRSTVMQHLDAACAACVVSPFDLQRIDLWGALHHHGDHEPWHDDAMLDATQVATTRRISWAITLHSDPRMFDGGDLEFADGTKIPAAHNQLVMWHPVQQHRIAAVECYTSRALHGRWSVRGYVHGVAPEGWADKVLALRGNGQ
jgi:Rps23 Pro-64 3,4-dihydroxylase Tpa1-like proline 4-hydroxylase